MRECFRIVSPDKILRCINTFIIIITKVSNTVFLRYISKRLLHTIDGHIGALFGAGDFGRNLVCYSFVSSRTRCEQILNWCFYFYFVLFSSASLSFQAADVMFRARVIVMIWFWFGLRALHKPTLHCCTLHPEKKVFIHS